MPGPSAFRTALIAAMAAAMLAGCASQAPRAEATTVASADTAEKLVADARETERVRRWMYRKRLCRDHAVRFDSAARCW